MYQQGASVTSSHLSSLGLISQGSCGRSLQPDNSHPSISILKIPQFDKSQLREPADSSSVSKQLAQNGEPYERTQPQTDT